MKKTHLVSGLILAEAVLASHVPASAGLRGLADPAVLAAVAPAAGAALAGSVFPDIDILVGARGKWNSLHRTITHWPPLYIMFGIGFYLTEPPFTLWFVMGCLLHLFLDSLTMMGIPIWSPFGKRDGFKLIRTGGLAEMPVYMVMFVSFVGIMGAWLHYG